MHILPKPSTVKNPAAYFTGDVWLDAVAVPQEEGQHMVVSLVRFAPGARTAWHSHAHGQTLHVTSGVAVMGSSDGTVLRVRAGETVYIGAGERHWHGATDTDFMEHYAMQEDGGSTVASTDWLDHVTEEEYATALVAAR